MPKKQCIEVVGETNAMCWREAMSELWELSAIDPIALRPRRCKELMTLNGILWKNLAQMALPQSNPLPWIANAE
jgi:hypothetical protein